MQGIHWKGTQTTQTVLPVLFINPNFSQLDASSDGPISCKCCGEGLLEIKCPYKYWKQHPITVMYAYNQMLMGIYMYVKNMSTIYRSKASSLYATRNTATLYAGHLTGCMLSESSGMQQHFIPLAISGCHLQRGAADYVIERFMQ